MHGCQISDQSNCTFAPVRGQTEFRKLTASDSPHPIPLLAHLLPPPSFFAHSRGAPSLNRLLAHLFDLSARKRKERRHFDDFRLWDRKNQKRDSVTSCSTGDSEIFKLDKKFLRHTNFPKFQSSPNLPYLKNLGAETFWRERANMLFDLSYIDSSFFLEQYSALLASGISTAEVAK